MSTSPSAANLPGKTIVKEFSEDNICGKCHEVLFSLLNNGKVYTRSPNGDPFLHDVLHVLSMCTLEVQMDSGLAQL